jgi:hypothetical protein
MPLSGVQPTSCSTPSDAIHRFLQFLYLGQPLLDRPLSGETPKQESRNMQIRREHTEGISYSELATKYQIPPPRIAQIIHGRRK